MLMYLGLHLGWASSSIDRTKDAVVVPCEKRQHEDQPNASRRHEGEPFTGQSAVENPRVRWGEAVRRRRGAGAGGIDIVAGLGVEAGGGAGGGLNANVSTGAGARPGGGFGRDLGRAPAMALQPAAHKGQLTARLYHPVPATRRVQWGQNRFMGGIFPLSRTGVSLPSLHHETRTTRRGRK